MRSCIVRAFIDKYTSQPGSTGAHVVNMTPYLEEVFASLVVENARKEAEERPRKTALAEDDDRSEALHMTHEIRQLKDEAQIVNHAVSLAHPCLI